MAVAVVAPDLALVEIKSLRRSADVRGHSHRCDECRNAMGIDGMQIPILEFHLASHEPHGRARVMMRRVKKRERFTACLRLGGLSPP